MGNTAKDLLEMVDLKDNLDHAEMIIRTYLWKQLGQLFNEEFGDECRRVVWIFKRYSEYPEIELGLLYDRNMEMLREPDICKNGIQIAFLNWCFRSEEHKRMFHLMKSYDIGSWDCEFIEALDNQNLYLK